MRPHWALIAGVVLTCGFAPAPFPKPPKKKPLPDIRALQGTWDIVSRRRVAAGGILTDSPKTAVKKVRIEGERWSYVAVEATGERVTVSYALSIENTRTPHWIDCVRETLANYAIRGLFTLEGDTLKIVYRYGTGQVERPLAMTDPPPGATVLVLQRQKP